MIFERVVEKFWGSPKTSIYFAGFYGDNFGTRAILFAIAVKLQNYGYGNRSFTNEEKKYIDDYISVANRNELTHSDNVKFIDFLHSL